MAHPHPPNRPLVSTSSGSADVKLYDAAGYPITLGQRPMDESVPVVLASDQTPIPVTGTITTSPDVNIHDSAGGALNSTAGRLQTDGSGVVQPVSGPLTDAQLRATPVPVSGTVATGGLTDAQLRASPVPVSGTVSTGGLTDSELRAAPVPVSAAALPLPAGASTAAAQTTGNASLASIDSKLSAPVAVSGPLTDAQLRATPVPVSGTVGLLSGQFINSLPIELAVSSQMVMPGGKDAHNVFIIGRRTLGYNSTTVLQDLAQYLDTSQDALNPVSTLTTYYIRSSNANDTAAGTGSRTVRIVWLDSSGNQQVTTATMNGTTGVSLGSGFKYFQWAEVATAGTAETPIGNITISSVAGAPTTAQIVEYIGSGGNRSLSARYMVPTGYTAFLSRWYLNSIGAANQDARLRAQVFADDHTLCSVFHFQDNLYMNGGTRGFNQLAYIPVPAGAEIKVSTIPSATGAANRADTGITILLVEN